MWIKKRDNHSNYKKEYQDYPFEVYFDNLINNKNSNMEVIKLSDNNEYTINLPLFLNSHSFEKTDIYNQPKTLYTKDCEPNPNFSGKTLMDVLTENNPYLLLQELRSQDHFYFSINNNLYDLIHLDKNTQETKFLHFSFHYKQSVVLQL